MKAVVEQLVVLVFFAVVLVVQLVVEVGEI